MTQHSPDPAERLDESELRRLKTALNAMLGLLCYDVAKPKKDSRCQGTVFTNSHVGTKTGGRPLVRSSSN